MQICVFLWTMKILKGDIKLNLSVVIATYNRCEDLRECLDSLFDMGEKPYEVIVIDSCSMDGTKEVKDSYPIEFFSIHERSRQKARNVGISVARGDVIAFLDDDVVVNNGWSKSLIDPYEDETVGAVGGRVIPYGNPSRKYSSVNKEVVGKVSNDGLVLGNFNTPLQSCIEVDCLMGCNMSVRKKILQRIGGFDENLKGTCYRDDTDCCLGVKRIGYKVLYQPKAVVWHKFKGKNIDRKWIYWYVRNHTYFYLKNIFHKARAKLPLFFLRTLFPPRAYVLKSGIKVKPELRVILSTLKGFVDGAKAWKKSNRNQIPHLSERLEDRYYPS